MSDYYMPMELLPPEENWKANSTRRLSRIELQKAMSKVKRFVERRLESDLNVFEVRSAHDSMFYASDRLGSSLSLSTRYSTPLPSHSLPEPESTTSSTDPSLKPQ